MEGPQKNSNSNPKEPNNSSTESKPVNNDAQKISTDSSQSSKPQEVKKGLAGQPSIELLTCIKPTNFTINELDNFTLLDVTEKLTFKDLLTLRFASSSWRNLTEDIFLRQKNLILIEKANGSLNPKIEVIIDKPLTEKNIGYLHRLWPNLDKLTLNCSVCIEVFDEILRLWNHVKQIGLIGFGFLENHFLILTEHLVGLESIEISTCKCPDNVFQIIISESAHLKHLSLNNISDLTGLSFIQLPSCIESIKIEDCPSITEEGWKALFETQRSKMNKIMLVNCSFSNDNLKMMTKNMKRLQHVELVINKDIQWDLRCFFDLSMMQVLKLTDSSKPSQINDKVLNHIFRAFDQLTELYITLTPEADGKPLTEGPFEELSDNCPKVKVLHLCGVLNISGRTTNGLKRSKQLTEFKLTDSLIDESSMIDLIKTCKSLRLIILINCKKIGKETVKETIAKANQVPNLFFCLNMINCGFSGDHRKLNQKKNGRKIWFCPANDKFSKSQNLSIKF